MLLAAQERCYQLDRQSLASWEAIFCGTSAILPKKKYWAQGEKPQRHTFLCFSILCSPHNSPGRKEDQSGVTCPHPRAVRPSQTPRIGISPGILLWVKEKAEAPDASQSRNEGGMNLSHRKRLHTGLSITRETESLTMMGSMIGNTTP